MRPAKTQAFSRQCKNRPISAASAVPVKSYVFRHADLRAGFSYLLPESGRQREAGPKMPGRTRRNSKLFWSPLLFRRIGPIDQYALPNGQVHGRREAPTGAPLG